ncbi:MAG: hypothetical protein Q8P67_15960 [archaeon]|nr:hypothetical protein [archaeon]
MSASKTDESIHPQAWLDNGVFRWKTGDPLIEGALCLLENESPIKTSSMEQVNELFWILLEFRPLNERRLQHRAIVVQFQVSKQPSVLGSCDLTFCAPVLGANFHPAPVHPHLLALELLAGQDACIVFLLEIKDGSLCSFAMPGTHHVAVGWSPDHTADPQFVTFGHDDEEINLATLHNQRFDEIQVQSFLKASLLVHADALLSPEGRILLEEETEFSRLEEQTILPDYCTTIHHPPRWIVHCQIEGIMVCFEGSFNPFKLVSVAIRNVILSEDSV